MLMELLYFAVAVAMAMSSTKFIADFLSTIAHSKGIPEYLASTLILSATITFPVFLITLISNLLDMPEMGMMIVIGTALAMMSIIMGFFLITSKRKLSYERNRNSTFLWAAALLLLITAEDGLIDRMDAIFMLLLFAFYTMYLYYNTKRSKEYAYLKVKPHNIILLPMSVFALLISSYLIVLVGDLLMSSLHIHPLIFMTGVVSLFLTLPLINVMKNVFGRARVIFDNIVSNAILLLTLVPGFSALINPMPYWSPSRVELVPLIAVNMLCLMFAIITKAKAKIGKKLGWALILLYLLSLTYLLFR